MKAPIIAVAPMMDWTDRHCRYLLRLISPQILLYTEMVVAAALLHADPQRWLVYDPQEQPLALQIGGSDPEQLAQCARLGATYGFQEINLNVGCPSPRVSKGRFGACLMREPERVADCVHAMVDAVSIPITVKTRLGVDHHDTYPLLCRFVEQVAAAGCERFIIHARKAWLRGLNPKQNRSVPPLRYDWVYQLKRDFPALTMIINGGIKTVSEIREHLNSVDGVMLGRSAYHNPYGLAEISREFYPHAEPMRSRQQVLQDFVGYARSQLESGVRLSQLSRHLHGLFHGQAGATRWRQLLNRLNHQSHADIDMLLHFF